MITRATFLRHFWCLRQAMPVVFVLLVALSTLFLSGCASTTVTLVPDENGQVGEATVTDVTGKSELLHADGASVKVDSTLHSSTLDEARRTEQFRHSLAALPEPGVSLLLYFASDSSALLPEHRATLAEALAVYQQRAEPHVMIIGHTDSAGDEAYNNRLALQRAKAAAAALLQMGVDSTRLRTEGFGMKDPLVPTTFGAHEPRNRRVEVYIW